MKTGPSPWEVEMIMAIDNIWLQIRAEKAEEERQVGHD